MRSTMTMTMAVVMAVTLLSGCGAAGHVAGSLAAPAPQQAMRAQAAGTFFQVFPAEPFGWTEVGRAARAFFDERPTTLPLGPKGEPEPVTGVLVQDLAARRAGAGRTEFVGQAQFQGLQEPNSFWTHQKTMPFRMILDASGKRVSFKFEGVRLDGLRIERPAFKAVGAAEGQRIEADVLAFLKAAPQSTTKPDSLWAAMLGTSPRLRATVIDVKATPGAFGDFGRAIQLKVDSRHIATGSQLAVFTVTALADKDGRLTIVR